MAIFGTKQKKKNVKEAPTTPSVPHETSAKVPRVSSVLLHPRVTEKSSMLSEKGSYVFEISARANKHEVFEAIKNAYGVTPLKINITNLPAKRVFSRGRAGMKSGVKKAVVYLKKGDKIEIV